MKWKEGQQFENPPAGSHIARCYSLIDLGTQVHNWNNESRLSRDVRLSFELPLVKMSGKYNEEMKGKPFAVHLTVKQSLHPKANLRRYLEGWRGKKFDKESLASFVPRKLVGLACRLAVVENGEYMNVDGIAPLGKGEKCPKQVNESVYLSLEPDEFDAEVFTGLHERTQEKIKKSPEYAALDGQQGGAEDPQADPTDGGEHNPDDQNDQPF